MAKKGKAGENNLNKNVGADTDTFHNCKNFSWLVLVLVLEVLWNQHINLEKVTL